MQAYIYAGAVAPEAVRVKVTQGDAGIDLTTATAVDMVVRRADGGIVTWASTIVAGATPTQLIAEHVLVAGDADLVGTYVVVVRLTVPGGTIRSVPRALPVLDPFTTGSC